MATVNQVGVGLSGSTGTGTFVGSTSPTLITPTLGVATATSINFSTTSGIIGTTTNNNAAALSVGEYISSQINAPGNSYTSTGVPQDLTSISLTAGDWDVEGNILWYGDGSTTIATVNGWISTTSATLPDPSLIAAISYGLTTFTPFSAGNYIGFTVPKVRVSIASTQTVYISGNAIFGIATLHFVGGIYARRVR